MNSNMHPWRRVAVQGLLVACALALVAASGGRAAQPPSHPVSSPSRTASIDGVVNLNTATPEELQLLPGVGEVRAVAIVARRKERGGFKNVDELLDVKGIGEAMLERMRPFVTLTGKTTARRL
jgi:competence protein ComEA